jgi:hypothetical protein
MCYVRRKFAINAGNKLLTRKKNLRREVTKILEIKLLIHCRVRLLEKQKKMAIASVEYSSGISVQNYLELIQNEVHALEPPLSKYATERYVFHHEVLSNTIYHKPFLRLTGEKSHSTNTRHCVNAWHIFSTP